MNEAQRSEESSSTAKLERIYKQANGGSDKISTEAIFKAMQLAIDEEREACANVCEQIAMKHQKVEGSYSSGKKSGAFECMEHLRSNVV